MNAGKRGILSLITISTFLTACLTDQYRIPQSELQRLATLPPEARGQRVRVVQQLTSDEPPERTERVSGGAVVVVEAPIWVGGRPRPSRYQPPPSSGPSGGGLGPGQRPYASNLGAAKKDSAKVLLILASIAAIGFAVTEGARYDGWVSVHPMQPVHIWGAMGYTQMPLAHITPEVAAWARSATLRPQDGPWNPLGRAPLNRQGWTYSVFLGSGEVPMIGLDPQAGFMGHIQFGYYPLNVFGIQLDLGYGWADDPLGNTVFHNRTALEFDLMPVHASILHAGLFGQVGWASRSDDGLQFDDSSGFLSGGALLQLELTTRLAITGRAGITRMFGDEAAEFTAGVSIY